MSSCIKRILNFDVLLVGLFQFGFWSYFVQWPGNWKLDPIQGQGQGQGQEAFGHHIKELTVS